MKQQKHTTNRVVFFCRGRIVGCLEVPFSVLGGSDLRSFGSYAVSGLVTQFFRLENQISSKKESGHEGGLTILEFIIPKVSDHAFNGGVACFFFQECDVVCRSKTERQSSHMAHMLNLVLQFGCWALFGCNCHSRQGRHLPKYKTPVFCPTCCFTDLQHFELQ